MVLPGLVWDTQLASAAERAREGDSGPHADDRSLCSWLPACYRYHLGHQSHVHPGAPISGLPHSGPRPTHRWGTESVFLKGLFGDLAQSEGRPDTALSPQHILGSGRPQLKQLWGHYSGHI